MFPRCMTLAAHIAAVLVVLLCASDALADKRVALVFGNSSYADVPALDNPVNDLTAELEWRSRGHGFSARIATRSSIRTRRPDS